MDRVDIHLEMVRVPFQKLASLEAGESSSAIRCPRGDGAQGAGARFRKWGKPGVMVNGDMGPAEVQQFCDIDEAGRNLMRAAMQQMNLSRAGVPSHPQAGPHHRRPGRRGECAGAPPGRSPAVPAAGDRVKSDGQRR